MAGWCARTDDIRGNRLIAVAHAIHNIARKHSISDSVSRRPSPPPPRQSEVRFAPTAGGSPEKLVVLVPVCPPYIDRRRIPACGRCALSLARSSPPPLIPRELFFFTVRSSSSFHPSSCPPAERSLALAVLTFRYSSTTLSLSLSVYTHKSAVRPFQ